MRSFLTNKNPSSLISTPKRESVDGQPVLRELLLSRKKGATSRLMVAYEFYKEDQKGKKHPHWMLPERKKESERVTRESIINRGRKVTAANRETNDISFMQAEMDEAGIESNGRIPLPELRRKPKKKPGDQFLKGVNFGHGSL